jgi:hypothetical protein
MKPVDQIVKHDPDNGQHGDCMRACIASLLELPAVEVPHFLHDGCDQHVFNRRINEFLALHDACLMVFNSWDMQETIDGSQIGGDVYHIISGPSPRGDWWHSVVGCNGRIVHDPHPDKTGLAEGEREFGLILKRNALRDLA